MTDTAGVLSEPQVPVKTRADAGRATTYAFAGSMCLSAALLFTVQPMFTKMALPLLGGSPGVWNTAVVFFQAVLLGGYLYAHWLTKQKWTRAQIAFHAGVLAIGAFFLPLSVSTLVGEPPAGAPAFWLLALFAVSIGAPFFAISATAPLLQAWYARTGRPDADDPYHLYAASNIGSLVALLAYPIVFEPVFATATQAQAWAWGYGLLAVGLIGCGVLALWSRAPLPIAAARPLTSHAPAGSWRERLTWMALAAAPSSLLLGVTTHITTDVASAPFLWVAPLALFLLTFVIAFATKPAISHATVLRILPIFAVGAGLILARPGVSWSIGLPMHLAAFFVAALACHGALVARRPSADRLTEFYVFMSLGGVIGGAFTALLAPMIFSTIIEYPLVFVASMLVLPALAGDRKTRIRLALGAGLSAVVAFNADLMGVTLVEQLGLAGVAIFAYLLRDNRWWFAGAMTLLIVISVATAPLSNAFDVRRGFFGVHKVVDGDGYRVLVHGTTIHGVESLDEDKRGVPMAYYGDKTPIGQVFQAIAASGQARHVGAVGLGAGSVACYAAPEQDWVFFEIDPIVRDIASDPARFSFLSSCKPDAAIVIGDARLTLADEADGGFDLLLIDAFSSDVVPAHLITREAVALYASKLAEDGVLVMHISNRILDLERPLADIAADLGLAGRVQQFTPDDTGSAMMENQASDVFILARDEAALAQFDADGRWRAPRRGNGRVWTDDYVNLVGAIYSRWRHGR